MTIRSYLYDKDAENTWQKIKNNNNMLNMFRVQTERVDNT